MLTNYSRNQNGFTKLDVCFLNTSHFLTPDPYKEKNPNILSLPKN